MQGLLRPGSLSPGSSCCACAGCCGGTTCTACPSFVALWEGLADGEDLGTDPPAVCTFGAFGFTGGLLGTGDGRVWADGDTTAHANAAFALPGNCVSVAATLYAFAENDTANLAWLTFGTVQIIGEAGDTNVHLNYYEDDVTFHSTASTAGDSANIEIILCDGQLTYLVDDVELASYPMSNFGGAQTNPFAVALLTSHGGMIGPPTIGCPGDDTDFLLLETGDFLLLETGDRILLET